MAGTGKESGSEPLKRLGGGRWQSRDERFTIEPQSGTWVVVDAEQVDDLGLPLVRGPFGSLGAAKDAMASARSTEAVASPLADRTREAAPTSGSDAVRDAGSPRAKSAKRAGPKEGRTKATSGRPEPAKGSRAPASDPKAEPPWLAQLEPRDRRRARRLIDDLAAAGAKDPEGIVRRDLIGDIPSTASFAIRRRLLALDASAATADVVSLLVDGRDEELGVRWRLVDGKGRPIGDLSG